jgi:nondiscriminating glutamyl-tRNA synthetase
MTPPVRVRFAPSPTGHLHVGGARTALMNWLFARHEGGAFILRIEDTDTARSTKESEAAVLDDLRWLGLDWDEGPDIGGPCGPYRQSERLSIYREFADKLLSEGKAFLCYCTDVELEAKRKDALARGRVPQYDGTCRELAPDARAALEREGKTPSVRFRAPTRDVVFDDLVRGTVSFKREMLGDFVLLRSDGRPTYNYAVVVDDALMEISHVIRAEEHLPNTMRQLLVYEALDFAPPAFAHVSLIVDKDRSKLSKRRGATSVREFRELGYLPDGLVNYLALLGWSPPDGEELMTRADLVRKFDLSRVASSPAAFDEDKLDSVNSHHIRLAPLPAIAELARPYAAAAGLHGPEPARFEHMVGLVRDGVAKLSDIPGAISIFFDGRLEMEEEARECVASESGRRVVGAVRDALAREAGAIDPVGWSGFLKGVGKELGVSGRDLFMPVRAALTGRTHGPALGEIAVLLGRARVAERLGAALERGSSRS